MKKALAVVLLWVLLLSLGIQVAFAEQVTIPNQSHIILESIGDPETVDPAWAYDTASAGLIFHVYDTLIDFDAESVENFVPELATEWTVSPDGLTYTFKIRENVKFQDGSIMTTEDVEYSFEHILVEDRSGGPEWMFYEPLFVRYHADMAWPEDDTCPINSAVESNATHVWFNLDMTYPPFMQILSQSWASILNKDFCIDNGDWPGTFNNWKSYHDPATAPLDVAGNVMCGTGPYKLDYWSHGVEWSVVKFDDYWQGWPAPSCSRTTERITEKVVYEWGTRLADFRAGTADGVYVPRAYIAQVEGWPGIRGLKDMPSLTCGAIFFNFDITMPSPYVGSGALDGNGIPPDFFADEHVRKAFAYAFNHTKYIEEIFLNEAETPPTPHIKGLSYAAAVWSGSNNPTYGYLDQVPIRDIDFAKVEEEMKLAFGGEVWNKGFKMTISYNAGNVPRMTAALTFKENMAAINSNFEIDTVAVTWSTYLGELWYYPTYRSIMPIFIIGWLADYPDPHNFVMPFQHADGDFAYPTSYNNPTVNALIEAGIAESDPVEREYIYWQIGWSYYNDQPSIALYQPLARRWERDWVQGYYYNSIFPMTYYHHIWKGLNADVDGDNTVGLGDTAMLSSHWSSPAGPLGYDRIADLWPYLQHMGDLAPADYLPKDQYEVPLPSIGVVDGFDWAAINEHWGEYV